MVRAARAARAERGSTSEGALVVVCTCEDGNDQGGGRREEGTGGSSGGGKKDGIPAACVLIGFRPQTQLLTSSNYPFPHAWTPVQAIVIGASFTYHFVSIEYDEGIDI